MRTFLRRILNWLRRDRAAADLEQELDVHHALAQERLEASGLSPDEAARETRRALGNVTLAREDARRVWIWPWLESVWQDVKYALRTSLYGLSPFDPLAHLGATAILITAGALAVSVPAWCATRVDPVSALQAEWPAWKS